MNINEQVLEVLANHIGVEKDDINEEDHLIHDLHMNPSDISDLLELLEEKGINTSKIDLSEIKSVADLIEAASAYEE